MSRKILVGFIISTFASFSHPMMSVGQSALLDFYPFSSLGQSPTPQAATLGQYGDIPVSLYTGRANINIPIHSFSESGITLDINLTYDTSGLLINQLPGWVGPGWSINTGGVITRSQQGLCDEMTFSHQIPTGFQNYFHSYEELQQYITTNNDWNISQNYRERDYDPDIFYFNFMGKTGHFFLGCDGTWKVVSEDNIAVVFNYNDPSNYTIPLFEHFPPQEADYDEPKAIAGFILYDDDGNKYTFGNDTSAVEYSMDFFHGTQLEKMSPWVATSWYLTKVEDRFDNVLFELSYRRGKFMAQLYQYMASSESTTYQQETISFPCTHYSGTLTSPVYPNGITTRGGLRASFLFHSPYTAGTAGSSLYPTLTTSALYGQIPDNTHYYYLQDVHDTRAKSLRVLLSSNQSDPLTALDYKHLVHIFISSTDENDPIAHISYMFKYDTTNKIQLKNIEIRGDQLVGKYTFTYNGLLNTDFLTTARDLWGYSNSPLSGMLQEIKYPTGGSTLLEYENNDYSSKLSVNRQYMISSTGAAGGLRIKSITEMGDNETIKKRTFSYRKPNSTLSSGQLFREPATIWNWKVNAYSEYYASQSLPDVPLRTSDGIIVGYSDVTETNLDGTTHYYHFSNFSDFKDTLPVAAYQDVSVTLPYNRYGERNFMRGKLLSETVKDKDGTIYQQKEYRYRQDENVYSNEYSLASNLTLFLGFTNIGCIYKKYYPKYDLERVITSTKYDNGTVRDTLRYDMQSDSLWMTPWGGSPNFRVCTAEKLSRVGQSVRKVYTYSSAATDLYFLPRTSTLTYLNGTLSQTERVLYQTINNHYLPKYETSAYSTAVEDTVISYISYSPQGLPLLYQRPGEFPTRLFWNNKGKLLATLTSPYDDVICQEYTYFPNNFLEPLIGGVDYTPRDIVKKNGNSIFDYPNVKATTYIYDTRGNIHATATGNGQSLYYYYDDMERLKEIRNDRQQTLQKFTYRYTTGN